MTEVDREEPDRHEVRDVDPRDLECVDEHRVGVVAILRIHRVEVVGLDQADGEHLDVDHVFALASVRVRRL